MASASSATAGRRSPTTRGISWPATRFRSTGWISRSDPEGAGAARSDRSGRTRIARSCSSPTDSILEQPTTGRRWRRRSASARTLDVPLYDLIIIGGGPAGLAAAVYGASEGLRHAARRARMPPVARPGMSSRIENYLGFPSGLSGDDLARRATTQAQRFGAEFLLTHEVARLNADEGSVGVDTGGRLGHPGALADHCDRRLLSPARCARRRGT